MSELHLFDFDGTLFKSPDRPDWWGPKTWLVDPASLGPPCVPLKPGSDWWIGSSVRDAKRSISDSDVWAILCTGRADMGSLRYRVAELLKQKGLNFDEVFLNPTNNTESYKIQVMLKILQKHPHIDTVQIWEDHAGHLPKFVKAIEATGRTCIPHLVKSTKHEVVCVQEDMEKLVAEGWSKWRKAMKTKVAVLHLAKDSKAQEYVKDKAEELKEKGYDDDKAFAVAWSIYCKYKSKDIPDSEGHCQKSPSEYFPNKKASNKVERWVFSDKELRGGLTQLEWINREDGDLIAPVAQVVDDYEHDWDVRVDRTGKPTRDNRGIPRAALEEAADVDVLFTRPNKGGVWGNWHEVIVDRYGSFVQFKNDSLNRKLKASPSSQREVTMNTTTQRVAARYLRRTAGKIPSKAPRDVKQVAKAWQENAMEAAEAGIAEDGETGSEARGTRSFWKDRLYVSEMDSDKGPRWLISDNYERAATLVYYPDSDEWFYMPMYGSEKLMRGGTREALANAQIIWTG